MRNLAMLTLVTMLLTFSAQYAGAVIYKYRDDSGRTIFVDDESKIPPRYRQATSTIKEQKDLQPALADQASDAGESGDAQEPGEATDSGDATGEDEQAGFDDRAAPIIDFASRAEAQKQAADQEKRRAYTTPVMIRGDRILVPVEVSIGNRLAHLNMLIDPTATTTIFHRNALGELQLPAGERIDAFSTGGRTLPAEKILFQYIEVGPFRELNTAAIVIDPKGPSYFYDGLLGTDFLQDHPFDIDTKHEQLYWKFSD